MKKRQSKDIIGAIKSREASAKKGNFTFSLNVETVKKFKEKCERADVSMASVVEQMISDFLDS